MSRVIVAGSGIAGLTCALKLSGRHTVTLITKDELGASNTAWAQGGIAGVIGPDDTVESHIADTLAAGSGHCDAAAVRVLCEAGGDAIFDLVEAGVGFDTDGAGAWSRALEGAHSHARIFHSGGDATGRAISSALAERVRAEAAAGRIDLLEHTLLTEVTTEDDDRGTRRATGLTVLHAGHFVHMPAESIVLATGGAGQLFAHTTNPPAATGDGLAAAIRAGASVRDLEFFQFHPTALAGPGFLISEAVRGAGALLLDEHGHRFMPAVDPRAELAPRDVVALAIHRQAAAQEGRPCFLDARTIPDFATRFPSITASLALHGLDPAHDRIPVMPAAHYFMGGVAADVDGRTTIDGLFAIGEVACTGVHGANRLASNSLLEGAVFAARAAAAIDAGSTGFVHASSGGDRAAGTSTSALGAPTLVSSIDSLHHSALTRPQLQALTWDHLGVERTATGLRTLLDRLGEGRGTPFDPVKGIGSSHSRIVEDIETANLALIAEHMARHALARPNSLGAHTRTDSTSTFAAEPSPTAAPSTPTTTTRPSLSTRLLEETTAC